MAEQTGHFIPNENHVFWDIGNSLRFSSETDFETDMECRLKKRIKITMTPISIRMSLEPIIRSYNEIISQTGQG